MYCSQSSFIFVPYKANAAKATAANTPPMEAALAPAPLAVVTLLEAAPALELELEVEPAVLEEVAAVGTVAFDPTTVVLLPAPEVGREKPEDAVPEAEPEPEDPEDPEPDDPEVEFPEVEEPELEDPELVPVAVLEAEDEDEVALVTLEQLRS